MTQRNILVTGATGLVGRELCKVLALAGHNITILTQSSVDQRLLPFPAQVFSWKNTEAFPKNCLNEIDSVINLAGEPITPSRWNDKKKKKIFNSRVERTKQLCQAIETHNQSGGKVSSLISASAIGYYGDTKDQIKNEHDQPSNDFLAQVCHAWELASASLTSVRQVHLRIGVVLSSQGGALAKLIPVFQLGVAAPAGSGSQWMSWIHLEDLVRLIVFTLENTEISGVINAVSPDPVLNLEFSREIAKRLNSCFVNLSAFGFIIDPTLRGLLAEASQIILGSSRISSAKIESLGFKFKYSNLNDALDNVLAHYQNQQQLLVREQWVPQSVEKIFAYFCDEKNLESLTPDFLNFKVLKKSTDQIKQGTLIDYQLRIHGLPQKWTTEIETWIPNQQFVDNQVRGPYKKWHHTHSFVPMQNGTLLRDEVVFKLPLGVLGLIAAGHLVRADVDRIFNYRNQIIAKKFYNNN